MDVCLTKGGMWGHGRPFIIGMGTGTTISGHFPAHYLTPMDMFFLRLNKPTEALLISKSVTRQMFPAALNQFPAM